MDGGVREILARGRALARDVRRAREGLSPTRYDVIARCELMEVRRFRRPAGWRGRRGRPVLLVPPLMAKSFVFDLHERRSMAAELSRAGHDVYLVDWGEPGSDHQNVRIEDYVVRWLPRAIEAARADAGEDLGLVGYCLGGLFCLWHLGRVGDRGVDRLAVIASPVDSRKMGTLMDLARLGTPLAGLFGRVVGNVPGPLSAAAFSLTSPVHSVSRWVELWRHADDPAHVDGFAAMQAWMGDFASMPRGIFVELAEDFLRDNASYRGQLRLDGEPIDLSRVRVPVLAIAGAGDKVVGPEAVFAIREVVGSPDVRCVTAPGGHAGVLAGSSSADQVWTPIAEFMAEGALESVA